MTRPRAASLIAASIALTFGMSAAGCQAPTGTGENPSAINPGSINGSASSTGTGVVASAAPANAAPRAVANVGDAVVTQQQLDDALRASFGLETLMKLLELSMAEDVAKTAGVTITPADVELESDVTIANTFPNEDKEKYPELLKQLLQQQRLTQGDYNRVMRTNALLRAALKADVAKLITEEEERKAFNALYGERVRVRHIALSNPQEVVEAKRRLATEDFRKVAREMSRSRRTAANDGELPPFSRNSDVGKAFTEAAFALEVGQVSEAVQQDGVYHLIKLEERIAPRGFKFEDYRDSVRAQLELNLGTEKMLELRQALGRRALESVNITDPVLRAEFDRRKAEAQQQAVDKNRVLGSLRQPTTRVAAPGTPDPTSAPATPATATPAPTTPAPVSPSATSPTAPPATPAPVTPAPSMPAPSTAPAAIAPVAPAPAAPAPTAAATRPATQP